LEDAEIRIHPSGSAPDQLDAEEQASVAQRNENESDGRSLAPPQEESDNGGDQEERPVRERAPVGKPGVIEEAISDEQAAADAE
jgi:hypothetical protein